MAGSQSVGRRQVRGVSSGVGPLRHTHETHMAIGLVDSLIEHRHIVGDRLAAYWAANDRAEPWRATGPGQRSSSVITAIALAIELDEDEEIITSMAGLLVGAYWGVPAFPSDCGTASNYVQAEWRPACGSAWRSIPEVVDLGNWLDCRCTMGLLIGF